MTKRTKRTYELIIEQKGGCLGISCNNCSLSKFCREKVASKVDKSGGTQIEMQDLRERFKLAEARKRLQLNKMSLKEKKAHQKVKDLLKEI